jgi:hypothetical protein
VSYHDDNEWCDVLYAAAVAIAEHRSSSQNHLRQLEPWAEAEASSS